MRAARDLTAKLMDLDVTGIFCIVLTFEDTHFGIRWYVVCCETWAESVSWATMGAANLVGTERSLFCVRGVGLGAHTCSKMFLVYA